MTATYNEERATLVFANHVCREKINF